MLFISDSMREEGQLTGISGADLSGTATKVLKPFAREDPLGLLAVHYKSSHCNAERKTGGYAAPVKLPYRRKLVAFLVFFFSLQPAMYGLTKIKRNLGPSPPE